MSGCTPCRWLNCPETFYLKLTKAMYHHHCQLASKQHQHPNPCQCHQGFSSSLQPKYCPGIMWLNFSVCFGTGFTIMAWAVAQVKPVDKVPFNIQLNGKVGWVLKLLIDSNKVTFKVHLFIAITINNPSKLLLVVPLAGKFHRLTN